MPRPKLNPTEMQRSQVRALAACGVPEKTIARWVGVRSEKTVRKHFRQELAFGALEANANVANKAYEMAVSGKHPGMTRFWLERRAPGWPRHSFTGSPAAPPPFIVAKDDGGMQ